MRFLNNFRIYDSHPSQGLYNDTQTCGVFPWMLKQPRTPNIFTEDFCLLSGSAENTPPIRLRDACRATIVALQGLGLHKGGTSYF